METKDLNLKIKSTLDDVGKFTGLAAIYGEVDLEGDVIEKGAFSQSINQQKDGFPLLWAHRQDVPLGLAKLEDTNTGPLVHGTIHLDDPDGKTAFNRVKRGVVRGLSIGYLVPRDDGAVSFDGRVRRLRKIHLLELSLVAIPAQPGAQITSIKSVGEARAVIQQIRGVGNLDAETLRELRAIKQYLDALIPHGAVDGGVLAELRDFAAGLRG